MKYKADFDLHIHSQLSLCSGDPEQTAECILNYGEKTGLTTLCVTDHFWDEKVTAEHGDWYVQQDFNHICQIKPLPKSDKVRFLFGCETEMDRDMNVALSKERLDEFDFIIVPTTHMHMGELIVPKGWDTPKLRAQLWVNKLNALLSKDLPFYKMGIAHLTCPLIFANNSEAYLETLASIKDEDMHRIFAKAAEKKVGIELNSFDFRYDENEKETVLRPYRIAKEEGCKFYTGSDAHHPSELYEAPKFFARAVEDLGLTEDDKFRI